MAVIAMTREMGTLGRDVAQMLCQQMGLELVHHELIEQGVAGRLGIQEGAVHRYLEGGASVFERWRLDSKRLSRYTAEEILELAGKGNVVIRGWGAAALLRDVSHVVCVRVCAPMAFRVKVIMERVKMNEPDFVRREIERNDAAHARLMEEYFDLDWKDEQIYDLVLNNESLTTPTCAKLIRDVVESQAFQETESSRSAIADKLLETRVRTALSDRSGLGSRFSGIEISAHQGQVVLSGRTFEAQAATDSQALAQSVSGVSSVENRVTVVRYHSGGV